MVTCVPPSKESLNITRFSNLFITNSRVLHENIFLLLCEEYSRRMSCIVHAISTAQPPTRFVEVAIRCIVRAIFMRYAPVWFKPATSPRAPLLLHHTLTYVYTLLSFPTYYTKPSVNSLFEVINKFE